MNEHQYSQGDYPQYLKDAVEAAGRNARQSQASTSDALSGNAPIFVVVHQETYMHSSDCNETNLIGTFVSIELANTRVLEIFKEEHTDHVEEDDLVVEGERPDLNQVTWSINKLCALSLEITDGGDGDFFSVYIEEQVLQH